MLSEFLPNNKFANFNNNKLNAFSFNSSWKREIYNSNDVRDQKEELGILCSIYSSCEVLQHYLKVDLGYKNMLQMLKQPV